MRLSARAFVRRAPEHRQFVRLLKWQRPQEDGVDHAEDGAVRADPKGEGDDGDDAEAGDFSSIRKA